MFGVRSEQNLFLPVANRGTCFLTVRPNFAPFEPAVPRPPNSAQLVWTRWVCPMREVLSSALISCLRDLSVVSLKCVVSVKPFGVLVAGWINDRSDEVDAHRVCVLQKVRVSQQFDNLVS
jgi:hypothetical protein